MIETLCSPAIQGAQSPHLRAGDYSEVLSAPSSRRPTNQGPAYEALAGGTSSLSEKDKADKDKSSSQSQANDPIYMIHSILEKDAILYQAVKNLPPGSRLALRRTLDLILETSLPSRVNFGGSRNQLDPIIPEIRRQRSMSSPETPNRRSPKFFQSKREDKSPDSDRSDFELDSSLTKQPTTKSKPAQAQKSSSKTSTSTELAAQDSIPEKGSATGSGISVFQSQDNSDVPTTKSLTGSHIEHSSSLSTKSTARTLRERSQTGADRVPSPRSSPATTALKAHSTYCHVSMSGIDQAAQQAQSEQAADAPGGNVGQKGGQEKGTMQRGDSKKGKSGTGWKGLQLFKKDGSQN